MDEDARGRVPHQGLDGLLTTIDNKRTMGRLAAAIWAAIAFFGAVSTVGKLRPPGADIEMMRAISVGSAVMAGVCMVFPWKRVPRAAFNVPLMLMTCAIAGLAYAEGSVRTDLTLLFTFVVIFAAYFMTWKAAALQLGVIAIVLAARMFAPELAIDNNTVTQNEALRLALLLPALAVFAGLVIILRRSIADRERRLSAQQAYDYQTGLLSKDEMSRVVDAAVTRASENARPLAIVMLDVSGEVLEDGNEDPEHRARVATMIARSILGRIRVEDRAARFGEFRFAVLGPETDANGAATFARGIVDVIRKRLMTLGYESSSFSIAVGWADYPRAAQSATELMEVARRGVEASIEANRASLPAVPDAAAAPTPAAPAMPSSAGRGVPAPTTAVPPAAITPPAAPAAPGSQAPPPPAQPGVPPAMPPGMGTVAPGS